MSFEFLLLTCCADLSTGNQLIIRRGAQGFFFLWHIGHFMFVFMAYIDLFIFLFMT